MVDIIQLCLASADLARILFNTPSLWSEINIAMQSVINTSTTASNAYDSKTKCILDELPDPLAKSLIDTWLTEYAKKGIRKVKIMDHAKFFFQQDDYRTLEMMQLVLRHCNNIAHFTIQSSSDIDYYAIVDRLNEVAPCSKEYDTPHLARFELIETHRPKAMLNSAMILQLQRALSKFTPFSPFTLKSCKECREYIGYQQPMCAKCLCTPNNVVRCPYCHWQCDDCGAHFCDTCQKKELVEVLLARYSEITPGLYKHNTPESNSSSTSCCPLIGHATAAPNASTTLLCSNCLSAHQCNRCDMLFASENLRHCDICQKRSFCSSVSDESLTIPEPTRIGSVPLPIVNTIYQNQPVAIPTQLAADHAKADSDDESDDDGNESGCCKYKEDFIRCKQCKMTGFCTSCLPQVRAGTRNWLTVCPTCDEFICPLCVEEGRLPLFFAPGYGSRSIAMP
ncbi:hypothetical protein NQZ79_g6891 [Umbelopsis isabellina]|nr:hypothetical protein NQZ79_g6891 [Umbelopsis isabellina]